MTQKLKIFVSLIYALIFLVFVGLSALQTHAGSPAPPAAFEYTEVQQEKIN